MRPGTGVSWVGMRYLPFIFYFFLFIETDFSVSLHPTPQSIADANILCLILWTIYAFNLYITIFAFESLVRREILSVSFCLELKISCVSSDLLTLTTLSPSKTQKNLEIFFRVVSFLSCPLNNRKSKSSLHTCSLSVFSPILWYSAHAFLLNGGIFF